MYHATDIQSRFCDTDMLGHINNTALCQWLEIGRVDLEQCCLPSEANVLLRKLDVDFIAEVNFPEPAKVLTGVDRLGTSSIILYQEIWQANHCCVTANAIEVWFDPATRRPAPVPEVFRQAYERLLFGEQRA